MFWWLLVLVWLKPKQLQTVKEITVAAVSNYVSSIAAAAKLLRNMAVQALLLLMQLSQSILD